MFNIFNTLQYKTLDSTNFGFIKDGNIIHAEFDDIIGAQAFKEIIKLNEGNFKVGMTSSSVPHSITESWNKLLLDCMT